MSKLKQWAKAQLMELINGVRREASRDIINTTISENRKIPLMEAKKKKMVLAHA